MLFLSSVRNVMGNWGRCRPLLVCVLMRNHQHVVCHCSRTASRRRSYKHRRISTTEQRGEMSSEEQRARLAGWLAGCGVWLLFLDVKLKDAVKHACETASPTAAASLFFNFSLPFLFISCDSEVRIKTNILMAAFMMLAGSARAQSGGLDGPRAGWCEVAPSDGNPSRDWWDLSKQDICKSHSW